MKIILLGITGSGKSTIANRIANEFGLQAIEADDEVIRLNHGLWPKNEQIIDKYFQITSDKILDMENVIYVISWLSKSRIKQFSEKSFKIIELHATMEELLKRKVHRDNPAESEINRFKKNFSGYYNVVFDEEMKPLITMSLDTTLMKPEEVLNKITTVLSQYAN